MFESEKNAYIKDLNALRILMNFLCIYLGEKGGGVVVHKCMYIYGNTWSAFTTELLNGCLLNLVGMKCSWSLTNFVVFQPDPSRGGSRAGQKKVTGVSFFNELLLQTGGLQQETKCIAMI